VDAEMGVKDFDFLDWCFLVKLKMVWRNGGEKWQAWLKDVHELERYCFSWSQNQFHFIMRKKCSVV